jgi:hypothetical protein
MTSAPAISLPESFRLFSWWRLMLGGQVRDRRGAAAQLADHCRARQLGPIAASSL